MPVGLTDAADAVESACRRRTFCCAAQESKRLIFFYNFREAVKQNVREKCELLQRRRQMPRSSWPFLHTNLWVWLLLFALMPITAIASTSLPDVEEIIRRTEENLNGKTAQMQLAMEVHTKRTKRTMRMKSYSEGKEKSFIRILYPGKDKGITFLKRDRQMWQYVPRIEKIIKIPASMMLQSWMGSDFTNDDLVKESSIYDDYQKKLLRESDSEFEIELIPNEEAAVVWGRVIMRVSTQYYVPTSVDYYDEDGQLIRVLYYSDYKKFGDRTYPTLWQMEPKTEEKAGRRTVIRIESAVFDGEIDKAYFTKRALKRFSR